MFRIITDQEIESLNIPISEQMKWIEDSFRMKSASFLPPKISVHPRSLDFFTTMPCLLPSKYNRFGVKVISRIEGNNPSLKSHILLYDTQTGSLLALLESNWITKARTAAVVSLSIKVLKSSKCHVIALMGLGNIGDAVLNTLLRYFGPSFSIKLLNYKDQAEFEKEKYCSLFRSADISIVDSVDELISGSDVVISCITQTSHLLCPNIDIFKKGVLLIPVHTRGFQNCDTTFERIVVDDVDHVRKFENFDHFKSVVELTDVLYANKVGRSNDGDKIISYNIGLGLHDILFASNIYAMINL
jgi:ornithine cyclodeaminase/alanine dehydrogenase-like protein (mu-crystallin family)